MTAYVFMIVIILTAYYNLIYHSKALGESTIHRNQKIFVIIACVTLFLVMGLRHPHVGTDTPQYLRVYHSIKYFRWNQVSWDNLLEQEIGFKLYNYVLNWFGVSDQMYLILYALFVSVVIAKLIEQYCRNLFWGFYFHITIGLFTMSMSGMRQTIACLICWLAISYILRKKPIRFILVVLLAASFHQSAIFFLPFYFAGYVRVSKVGGWMMISICVLLILFKSSILILLSYIMPEKYEIYGLINDRYPLNNGVVLIAVLIPAFCLFFWRNQQKEPRQLQLDSMYFLGSFCYAVITVLALSSQAIGRMNMYFYLFNVVLLGNIISEMEDQRTRYIVTMFAIVLPGYMFFKAQSLGISPYFFFWQTYGI